MLGTREFADENFGAPPPQVQGNAKTLVLSLLGLLLVLAWQAFSMRAYTQDSSRPPTRDEIESFENVEHSRGPRAGLPRRPTPPLYTWALARVLSATGSPYEALWLNWVCLAVLFLAMFAMAYHFRPDESGLIAAILLVGAPCLQLGLTTLTRHLPMAALSACAYLALLKSRGFERWPGSLAFGVLYALGLLTHWEFAGYMLPAYMIGISGLFKKPSQTKVLVVTAVALTGFAPWYLEHALDLVLLAVMSR